MRIGQYLPVVSAAFPAQKHVGIVTRLTDQSQYFSGSRIQGHNGTRSDPRRALAHHIQAITHGLLRRHLQVEIQSQVQIMARHGIYGGQLP